MEVASLANELSALFGSVAGSWSCSDPVKGEASISDGSRVGVICRNGQYLGWVQSLNGREYVTLSCSEPPASLGDHLPLLRKIVSVFNHDLAVIGDPPQSQEVWSELAETRFLRAAVRLSNISTNHLLRRIRTFEAASRQTYEGSAFAGSVVMAHNLERFRAHAGDRFRKFAATLTFEGAMLNEKWLKPFLGSGEFALVTTSYRGDVRGFTDATRPWPDSGQMAPIASLEGLYGYLRSGTSVLSASGWGDIYFALPSGVTFVKSKGRWRYQNWTSLRVILEKYYQPDVANQVLRLVQNSNYQHMGALYVILTNDGVISDVVPDHSDQVRPARTLRSTTTGAKIVDPTTQKLLGVASRIDGAIVIGSEGQVLDVASMIAEPSIDALNLAGWDRLTRFPGARSTAAWNASIFGLAIKVSDDGPVDVYERGKLVFHAG